MCERGPKDRSRGPFPNQSPAAWDQSEVEVPVQSGTWIWRRARSVWDPAAYSAHSHSKSGKTSSRATSLRKHCILDIDTFLR